MFINRCRHERPCWYFARHAIVVHNGFQSVLFIKKPDADSVSIYTILDTVPHLARINQWMIGPLLVNGRRSVWGRHAVIDGLHYQRFDKLSRLDQSKAP